MTSAAPERRRRLARLAVVSSIVAIVCVAAVEIALRFMTRQGGNGMACLGSVALLPFHPTPEIIERCLDRNADSTYVVRDAELGWAIGPDGTAVEAGVPLYRSNAQGVRADPSRLYELKSPPGRIRIVTVGDSFTHCDEVRDSETWQHVLEAAHPELEVLNLGVPGYGTDQALMRWRRDGIRFESQIVVLGIWPENICRNLSVMRYYLVPAESFAGKPRMLVDHGALRVIHSPVLGRQELIATLTEPAAHPILQHDYWYREGETRAKPLEVSRLFRAAESVWVHYERRQERARLYSGEIPDGIEITTAIALQFAREVRAAGSIPLVLFIPMRDQLGAREDGAPSALVRALRESGLDVLDLEPAFSRAIREPDGHALYQGSGHHSPVGNRLLAQELATQLEPWLKPRSKEFQR